jgi:hypothetical protein
MRIETKLADLGLVLPEPPRVPPGITLSFAWVRVRGNRAYFSGHGALNTDGLIAEPFARSAMKSPWIKLQRRAPDSAFRLGEPQA